MKASGDKENSLSSSPKHCLINYLVDGQDVDGPQGKHEHINKKRKEEERLCCEVPGTTFVFLSSPKSFGKPLDLVELT